MVGFHVLIASTEIQIIKWPAFSRIHLKICSHYLAFYEGDFIWSAAFVSTYGLPLMLGPPESR